MAKIVLATLGSYGDVNPYLALGVELKARGHRAVIATSSTYKPDIEQAGLEAAAVGVDVEMGNTELYRKIMDTRTGSEFIMKELVMPSVRESYYDFEKIAKDADLVLSHVITHYVPVFAQKHKKLWLSTVLSPMVYFSAYDPPVLAPAPQLAALRTLGPRLNRMMLRALQCISFSWGQPVRDLRKELGMDEGQDPLFAGQHSPYGVLSLFSDAFGQSQPDWPVPNEICGFPFWDQDVSDKKPDADLVAFLKKGEPPIVFTLGSSAVYIADRFYHLAMEAALKLGKRAVLVAGPGAEALRKENLPPQIFAVKSAPYHWIFPQASAIVHQGGVGTTAQALRSGIPQLVVPFAHDQPDNAARVERFAGGLKLELKRLSVENLEQCLSRLLTEFDRRELARRVGSHIRAENGVKKACDLIEAALQKHASQ